MIKFDICVIGAGPSGCVAAYKLAQSGARVVLVAIDSLQPGTHAGETAPAEINTILAKLEISGLAEDRAHLKSAGSLALWGSENAHSRESIMGCYGSGWHLNRKAFNRKLFDAATNSGVVAVRAQFRSASRTPRGWAVQVSANAETRTIESDHLVDCSGKVSRVGVSRGARRKIFDRLVGIWAVFAGEGDDGDRTAHCDLDTQTYVASCPGGWLYTARVPENRRVVAYFTDGDLIDIGQARSVDGFEKLIAGFAYPRSLIGEFRYRLVEGPLALPAMSARLNEAHGTGWIAAGDAAQCFDPLSSQGIVSAIIGGNNAAAALISCRSNGGRWAAQYEDWLEQQFSSYLAERDRHYCMECRWPDRSFWQRRQQRRETRGE